MNSREILVRLRNESGLFYWRKDLAEAHPGFELRSVVFKDDLIGFRDTELVLDDCLQCCDVLSEEPIKFVVTDRPGFCVHDVDKLWELVADDAVFQDAWFHLGCFFVEVNLVLIIY